MLLFRYTDQDYLDRALELLDRVRHPGYYAKMAVAQAVPVYFVRSPDQVMEYLKQSSLGDWTYNKALQKITKFFCVDKETKKLVRQIRRGRWHPFVLSKNLCHNQTDTQKSQYIYG